ncbi:Cystathionine beta-synthase [Aphelenchoides besseyi]|nr:Cystathionine beta-synthase [Aphelenchoides besseyi]
MYVDTSNQICPTIGHTIGHTPMVYLNKVTAGLEAKIALKLEYYSFGCSTKDRVAVYMINEAEKQGKIEPGKTIIIEPTSGNSGIALAACAASRGYKLILVMSAAMSLERRTLLRAYGAEVVLTPPEKMVKGAIERAFELRDLIENSVILNQFADPNNILAHYETTGPEIWQQSQGNVDVVCFGVGTGGTLSGVTKYLKEKKESIKSFAVEPAESAVLSGKPCGFHLIPGIGIGLKPDNALNIYDGVITVKSVDAIDMARRLACEEGILVGISGGANVVAAIELAKRPEFKGKLIVSSACDFGERYLTTILYSGIRTLAEEQKATTLADNCRKWKK